MFNSVCVYCGSHNGARTEYMAAARHLGQLLAELKIQLIYGGSSVGLMGVLADSVLAEGGRVTGIIPEQLAERELAHRELTQLHTVRDMHQRKALMAEMADAFIAMPGGMGTLEELFEALTWAQLGIHGKPCGVLNILGYYDRLLEFLDHQVEEEFVTDKQRNWLQVSPDPKTLLEQLAALEKSDS